MTMSLRELIHHYGANPTDGSVELVLADISPEDRRLASFQGELEGPFCARARTLRTTYPIASAPGPAKGRHSSVTHVGDPCYWTAELPFTYELSISCEFTDGTTARFHDTLGLRRWTIHGSSLFSSGKRIVLRGAVCGSGEVEWESAVRAETALILPASHVEGIAEASRLGVVTLVDFRGARADSLALMRKLAWEPSVVAAIFSEADESMSRVGWPLAATTSIVDLSGARVQSTARILVAEFDEASRPPAWLASCPKPVIAIRRGAPYADFNGARAACDRLQAELAPEFNLAGYFVAAN